MRSGRSANIFGLETTELMLLMSVCYVFNIWNRRKFRLQLNEYVIFDWYLRLRDSAFKDTGNISATSFAIAATLRLWLANPYHLKRNTNSKCQFVLSVGFITYISEFPVAYQTSRLIHRRHCYHRTRTAAKDHKMDFQRKLTGFTNNCYNILFYSLLFD